MHGNIDPVTRDVFQQQLVGIAEEMSMALRRAAFSSIIWDMYDYACGLFTPDGAMMAQAETIPAQLGIMSTALRQLGRGREALEVLQQGGRAGPPSEAGTAGAMRRSLSGFWISPRMRKNVSALGLSS